jgi:hypothetical protein
VSFEGAAGFAAGLAFGDLAVVEVSAWSGVAHLGDRDAVQCGVQLPVPASGEPVSFDGPGRRFDGCGAGVGGVVPAVRLAAVPIDLLDVSLALRLPAWLRVQRSTV